MNLIYFRQRKYWIQLIYRLYSTYCEFGPTRLEKDGEVSKDESSCLCAVFRKRFACEPSSLYWQSHNFFFFQITNHCFLEAISGCSTYTDQHMSSWGPTHEGQLKQQLIFILMVNVTYPTCVKLAAHEWKPACNDDICEKRTWTTTLRQPDMVLTLRQLLSRTAEVDTKLQTESEFKIWPCLQDFLI